MRTCAGFSVSAEARVSELEFLGVEVVKEYDGPRLYQRGNEAFVELAGIVPAGEGAWWGAAGNDAA
jgi:hypothetical protein